MGASESKTGSASAVVRNLFRSRAQSHDEKLKALLTGTTVWDRTVSAMDWEYFKSRSTPTPASSGACFLLPALDKVPEVARERAAGHLDVAGLLAFRRCSRHTAKIIDAFGDDAWLQRIVDADGGSTPGPKVDYWGRPVDDSNTVFGYPVGTGGWADLRGEDAVLSLRERAEWLVLRHIKTCPPMDPQIFDFDYFEQHGQLVLHSHLHKVNFTVGFLHNLPARWLCQIYFMQWPLQSASAVEYSSSSFNESADYELPSKDHDYSVALVVRVGAYLLLDGRVRVTESVTLDGLVGLIGIERFGLSPEKARARFHAQFADVYRKL